MKKMLITPILGLLAACGIQPASDTTTVETNLKVEEDTRPGDNQILARYRLPAPLGAENSRDTSTTITEYKSAFNNSEVLITASVGVAFTSAYISSGSENAPLNQPQLLGYYSPENGYSNFIQEFKTASNSDAKCTVTYDGGGITKVIKLECR